MFVSRVSGLELDGSLVSVTLGIHRIPSLKMSYGDSLSPEFMTDMGAQEQTVQTLGTYKTEDVAWSIRASIFRAILMPLLPQNGFGNVIFTAIIGYKHPDLGVDTDELRDCRIVNPKAAIESSAKGFEVELKMSVRQIAWTGARKTINLPAGAVQGVASL